VTTVLLADDNADFAESLADLLTEDGYSVVIARDGDEAVRLFGESRADVVLLDVTMPRMSGIDALDRIRSVSPSVPAILLTAYESMTFADRVRAAGYDVMLKPVHYPELASWLGALAER